MHDKRELFAPFYHYSLLMLSTGFSLAMRHVFTTTTPTIISKVTMPVMI